MPSTTALITQEIRVRMAPSPTGLLHFGTARTALFNWFFAKNKKGKFILRIEDTDVERSMKEFEDDIIRGLKWLGLEWDEGPDVGGDFGPYRQSEKKEIYENYLKKLIEEDKAYFCFCSKEELEKDKEAMMSQGLVPKYGGKCRNISKEVMFERSKKEPCVIRIKVPDIEIEFNDLIRGKISTNMGLVGDIVIARSLKSPLYLFSVVVDDYEMKISHVIRGEDHISNTPKQIIIQKALNFNEVKYAHLPLVLSPDRSKLSKRYMEVSLLSYKEQGYLPEALINFMAFLGWHPSVDGQEADKEEIYTKEELAKMFDIRKVQKAGAVFNVEKLDWLNNQHLRRLSDENLLEKLLDYIPDEWKNKREALLKIVKIEKERITKLADFREGAEIFFQTPSYSGDLLIWKNTPKEKIKDNLRVLFDELSKVPEEDFGQEALERLIMPLTEARGRGEVLWPLRAALSGRKASPGPFEIMEVLGREKTLRRIEKGINEL